MPIVLAEDLDNLIQQKADDFKKSLGNPFTSSSPAAPTPSSDSLTNPIGTGNTGQPTNGWDADVPVLPSALSSVAQARRAQIGTTNPYDLVYRPQDDTGWKQTPVVAPVGSDSLTNPVGTGNGPVSLPAPDAPVTAPLVAPAAAPAPTPDPNSMLDKNGVIAYVHQKAADFGLDPAAVLSVAAHEGLNTAPGSHWTLPGEGNISFGPPSWYGNGAGSDIIRQHGANAAAWSWTPPGIDYWLGQVAQSAKGLTGTQAISAIVHGFERPREDLVAGEIKNASNDYATYSQSGGALTTAGPAGSSDTTNPVNPSDSTPSATTTPSGPTTDPIQAAQQFKDSLGNPFQSATDAVGNTAQSVVQQAQAFKDSLGDPFKAAANAVGGALPDITPGITDPSFATSPVGQQAAGNPQNPFAVKDQAVGGLADTLVPPNTPIASGAARAILDPTNLAFGAGGIPMALGSAAGGQLASDAAGALGGDANAQSIAGAAGSLAGGLGGGAIASHAPAVLGTALEGLDRVSPPEVAYASTQHPALAGFDISAYPQATQDWLTGLAQNAPDAGAARSMIAKYVESTPPPAQAAEAAAQPARPLFGRGGVPGGVRDANGAPQRPTMPAPTQPDDLTQALQQSIDQAKATRDLRAAGWTDDQIQATLKPGPTSPDYPQVPTSTRPPTNGTVSPSPLASETPPPPTPSVSAPPTAQPVTDQLPKTLSGAKPRYGYGNKQFVLTFNNDVDKALYIVAQKTPSKADAAYMEFLRGVYPGASDAEIRQMGGGVRDGIKQVAKNAPAGPLQVPSMAKQVEQAAPTVAEDTPHVAYDQEGNVVSGTPSDEEPPTPPTPPDDTSTLPAEPAPEPPPLRGAAANQQPKNLLQRAQSAVGDVLNPAANAPKPVQEALQKYIGTKNLALVQVERQVDAGLLSRAEADQAIGQAKGAAQRQFLNDIRNSPEGVELKSVLAQHDSIDSQGENIVGNPKPTGWVDGDSLGIHGTWVDPDIAKVVKNTLAQGDSVPILSGVAAVQGQLKQLVLNSPFHAFQEAFQAVRLGAGQLDAAGTKDMLGASTLNAVNPGGFKAYMAKPETQSIVDRLVQAGGTLRQGEAQDFFNAAGLKGMAVRGGLGGVLSGGTTYVNDKAHGDSDEQAITDALTHAAIGVVAAGPAGSVIGKAIFNRQIPTLKIEGFRMLTENGISDQSAAAMVNQTFGGNNLQIIARSPLVQTLMRSTLLAPDWWEGFGRNFLSAIPGAPVSREMGGLARRQVAATAVTAAFTLEALNLLTTGHLSNQNQPGHELDLEIPHSMVAGIPGAPQGSAGQMDHIDILGPIKTMASALSTMPGEGNPGDAGAFAHGRIGTIPSTSLDIAQNNNPATGKPIVPPGSDPLETVGAVGGYAAGRTLPIGSTSADQGAKVSGPIGGAAEYVTGMRQTSETPDQASLRGYYANLDKAKADMHDWLQQQPEYQQATPAAQRSMQADKDIELEKYLREQNNVAPLDKGMPSKYIGVDDPREQVKIDEAKARVDAYKRDSLHSPRPSTEDYVLAAHSVDWRYTEATKARGVSNKTLDQRFQSAFTAPTP